MNQQVKTTNPKQEAIASCPCNFSEELRKLQFQLEQQENLEDLLWLEKSWLMAYLSIFLDHFRYTQNPEVLRQFILTHSDRVKQTFQQLIDKPELWEENEWERFIQAPF